MQIPQSLSYFQKRKIKNKIYPMQCTHNRKIEYSYQNMEYNSNSHVYTYTHRDIVYSAKYE